MKKRILLLVSLALLGGCLSSGPEKPLKEMAAALEKKDPTLFLAQMDSKRFAAAQINNLTQGSEPLRALDSVGKMLGLGGMDELLGSVMNMEIKLEEKFTRGVSTGELMLQCRSAKSPDCPWTPEALQNARVKELSPTTAVAQVTTQANITSWLALTKLGEAWRVVGQAPLEAMAARYAQGKVDGPAPAGSRSATPPPADSPAPPPPPVKEKPQAPVKL